MKELSRADYQAMRESARITAADSHGDKVLHLADGTYLKLFRVKRLITSARLFPYWRRFTTNAAHLKRLGVPTFEVIETYDIPHLNRTGVHYKPLPGRTLRELDEFDENLIAKLGEFLGALHESGVYLRSLHLGNVVQTPSGDLGLIDIADMKVHRARLSRWKRRRNFHHLARYEKDRQRIAPYLETFVASFSQPLQPIVREVFSSPVA